MVKQPNIPARDAASEAERRRRGMMATILTSSAGALAPVRTTGDPKTKLG